MQQVNLVYLMSLRNAAADKAGQNVEYKGTSRYMTSPLEYLVDALEHSALGEAFSLKGVIYDDDIESPRDRAALAGYGFQWQPDRPWIFPAELRTHGKLVRDMLHAVPSTYRRLPRSSPTRPAAKSAYERTLLDKLLELRADVVVVDGLLIILDELVRPGARFERRVVNIHPGITRIESPYERRGACATLDALYGASGRKVTDWSTLCTESAPHVNKTGASLHYVDTGIDSGEVIFDVLATDIDPDETILELRWNNFNRSLFPALHQGLALLAPHIRRGDL